MGRRHPLRPRLVLALALAVLTASGRADAQVDRGELRLRVVDATGAVLPGAAGTLISESAEVSRRFSTDAVGAATLADLPFGMYRLSLELSGFVTRAQIIDVHSAVPVTLQVTLDAGFAAVETVAAPLVDAHETGVIFSIGAAQIEDRLPAVPGRRLLDLVDAQPGWLMEANGVLHPRGSEYQTLFVVDGIPMDENRSPAFAPDLQEGELQAVNVLTGNFPAEYGRKLGGVIEVTTASDIQHGFHGSADVGGGSFGTATGSLTAAYGWSRRALTVSGSAARTNRYLDPPVIENYTNSGALGGVTVTYDERPGDTDRVRLTAHHRTTTFDVPNEHVQEAAGQRQQRTGTEDLAQASWTRVLGTNLVLNARGVGASLSGTLTSNEASLPIVVSQDRSLSRGFASVSLAADLGRHQVKTGGDLVFAPVDEALAYRITDPSAFEPGTAMQFAFDDQRTDHEQSAFVQDTMAYGPLTVSAGIRWDHYSFVVDDYAWSPRLGVAWAPMGPRLVIRGSYDRAFQTPAIENLLLASSPQVDVVGDAARLPVQPSRGNFAEGGVSFAAARVLRVDASAYRRTFSQFADDDVFLNTGISFPVAFESAAISGLDVKATLRRWRRLSGFGSYSLLKGTARLPLVGGLFLGDEALGQLEAEGDVPITQDQRHTLRGQLRVELTDRMWVASSLRYGSGLPVELEGSTDPEDLSGQFDAAVLDQVDFERGRVKPNFAVDAGAGIRLWEGDRRRATLRVEAGNLTNRLNVINFAGLFSGTALGAPRSVTARLQVEF